MLVKIYFLGFLLSWTSGEASPSQLSVTCIRVLAENIAAVSEAKKFLSRNIHNLDLQSGFLSDEEIESLNQLLNVHSKNDFYQKLLRVERIYNGELQKSGKAEDWALLRRVSDEIFQAQTEKRVVQTVQKKDPLLSEFNYQLFYNSVAAHEFAKFVLNMPVEISRHGYFDFISSLREKSRDLAAYQGWIKNVTHHWNQIKGKVLQSEVSDVLGQLGDRYSVEFFDLKTVENIYKPKKRMTEAELTGALKKFVIEATEVRREFNRLKRKHFYEEEILYEELIDFFKDYRALVQVVGLLAVNVSPNQGMLQKIQKVSRQELLYELPTDLKLQDAEGNLEAYEKFQEAILLHEGSRMILNNLLKIKRRSGSQ